MEMTFKPRVLLVNGKPMTTSLAIAGHFEAQATGEERLSDLRGLC